MERKTINLTPDYSAIFRFAINIVKKEIPDDGGKGIVVEMLEYGKRLYEVQKEE